jgi:hypothetical protein
MIFFKHRVARPNVGCGYVGEYGHRMREACRFHRFKVQMHVGEFYFHLLGDEIT